MVANRAGGLPGAHFRALYLLAGGLLKFRERMYADRVNFAAQIAAPINAQTLRNAALWQYEILFQPPKAARTHVNLLVRDAEHAQLDRVVSTLLVSERMGSINIFFDDAAMVAGRLSASTMLEESRGASGDAFDLNAYRPVRSEDFTEVDWSPIFSGRTGFDGNVNTYLKVAHPGALVVALSLPETDDGFCDPMALQAWFDAVQAFRSPIKNVSFVILNAVGQQALPAELAAGGSPGFARKAGLSLAEAIRLAQHADAFVGHVDIFGVAACAAHRPGVYLGAEPGHNSNSPRQVVLAPDSSPAQACQALGEVLATLSEREATAGGIVERAARLARRLAGRSVSPEPLAEKYTLVIPTYNRPELLERLLRYLQRTGAQFPVHVLDSSRPEIQARNQKLMSDLPLDIRHAAYDQTTEPYVKIGKALNNVSTAYCSICADDDVLIASAISRCVAELERDPKAALAHGYYFNFREQETFNLSYVMYRGRSIDEAASLSRLRTLFAAYEALFYGVFRTSVALRAFRDVEQIDTVLAKELLTGGLAVIAGKALRIPCFYYGRNTAESLPYHAWHPHQILAHEPGLLFADYPLFRSLLLKGLQEAESVADDAAKIIDLIFLRYLQPFLRHEMLDLMLDMSMRGRESNAIYEKVWDTYVRLPRRKWPVEPLIDPRGKFSPTRLGSGRPRDYEWASTAWDGKERKYRAFYEFIFPEMQPTAIVDRNTLVSLLGSLNAY